MDSVTVLKRTDHADSRPATNPVSDDDRKQIKRRNRCRRFLGFTFEMISNARSHHIEADVCEKANIIRQPLSIEEDSDCNPFFFAQYRGELKPWKPDSGSELSWEPEYENYENVRDVHFSVEHHVRNNRPLEVPGSYNVSWGQINCGELFETIFDWQSSMVALPLTNPHSWPRNEGPEPALPHVRCMMGTDAVGDDRLLRSELRAIIQIMSGRLWAKSLRPHLTAPVLLFSCMGPWHIRVLEAYSDGERLIVRNTKLYDLRENEDAVKENLSRWWYGAAIQDTKIAHRGYCMIDEGIDGVESDD